MTTTDLSIADPIVADIDLTALSTVAVDIGADDVWTEAMTSKPS